MLHTANVSVCVRQSKGLLGVIVVLGMDLFPREAGAGEAAIGKQGFIQVAPSKRYFQWEDGTPFFPTAQNDWPPAFDLRKRSKKDPDDYFKNLNAHRVNVLRLMVDVGKERPDSDGALGWAPHDRMALPQRRAQGTQADSLPYYNEWHS